MTTPINKLTLPCMCCMQLEGLCLLCLLPPLDCSLLECHTHLGVWPFSNISAYPVRSNYSERVQRFGTSVVREVRGLPYHDRLNRLEYTACDIDDDMKISYIRDAFFLAKLLMNTNVFHIA